MGGSGLLLARAQPASRGAGRREPARAARFPASFDEVAALPGIGRSTAGAILVFARGARHPILDGNVKRVLARLFGITGYPGDKRVADRLWQRAEELLPRRGVEAYTQGLMDLGAGVCARARPRCEACPWSASCVARKRGLIAAIPGRKPRKALPQKATTMLALTRAGEVLLEKRPPAGIWGGMWCLPEAAREACRYDRRHTACANSARASSLWRSFPRSRTASRTTSWIYSRSG